MRGEDLLKKAAEVLGAARRETEEKSDPLAGLVDEIDPDLGPVFFEEAEELMPQVDNNLREWRERPADGSVPGALMRLFHTIKGSARMAGAMRFGQMIHELETQVEDALAQPPVQPRKKWRARYVVYFLDFLSITAALTFGAFASTRYSTYRIDTQSTAQELATLAVITALWMGIIWLNQGYAFHSRVHSTIGIKSVVKSSLYLAGILALFDTIFTTPFIHPYLLVSIPVGIVLISIMRAVSALTVRRIKRHRPSRLLFVGKSSDILDVLGNNFNLRFPYHQIAAFLLTDPENKDALPQLEDCHFVSYLPDHDVAQTAKQLNCDAVWVASVTDFGNKNLRRLAWNLRSVKDSLFMDAKID